MLIRLLFHLAARTRMNGNKNSDFDFISAGDYPALKQVSALLSVRAAGRETSSARSAVQSGEGDCDEKEIASSRPARWLRNLTMLKEVPGRGGANYKTNEYLI
jgi:hypothetical protein